MEEENENTKISKEQIKNISQAKPILSSQVQKDPKHSNNDKKICDNA